jgi:hypothetical protein
MVLLRIVRKAASWDVKHFLQVLQNDFDWQVLGKAASLKTGNHFYKKCKNGFASM